jgi:lysophospholipase L1-like esterase
MTFPLLIPLLALLAVAPAKADEKPTLFLIGDSTVRNSTKGQVGWGSAIGAFFDSAKITVQNRALGGRSSRSYLREGLWDKVLADVKANDFVIMQFGHNDNGPLDAEKARASLKGNSDEAREVTLKETGATETVHSYGWYLRKYIADTKAKGATPIVCSPIPRNMWQDGKVLRANEEHGKWAKEAAEQGGALFIDLNTLIADRYDALGQEKVQPYFTAADHTHTSQAGAELNASCVVKGIRDLNYPLRDCLRSETTTAAQETSP